MKPNSLMGVSVLTQRINQLTQELNDVEEHIEELLSAPATLESLELRRLGLIEDRSNSVDELNRIIKE